jgi:hypothetical protein
MVYIDWMLSFQETIGHREEITGFIMVWYDNIMGMVYGKRVFSIDCQRTVVVMLLSLQLITLLLPRDRK